MPITITLEDGTTRELPEGFPTTQKELDAIRDRALAPKLQRVSELEGHVQTLTSEKEAAASQVSERDEQITTLTSQVDEKDRALLVTQVAHTKGVPAKWLSGDDQAALEASADEWLTDAKGIAAPPANPGGDGGENGGGEQSGNQAGGYVGSAGTGEEQPPRPSFDEAKQAAYERARKQKKGVLTS